MRKYSLIALLSLCCVDICSAKFSVQDNRPTWEIDNKTVITTPSEGLWSVATAWRDGWAADWVHIQPTEQEISDDWTIVRGSVKIGDGKLVARDAYKELDNGLTQCVRRYEWDSKSPLDSVTLSVRMRVNDQDLSPFAPGIIYYGNPNGANVDKKKISVYNCEEGEFAIFEDHRYSMPFFMVESSKKGYSATIHTVPSPVRGAVLSDQWWSMGAESYDGYTELVLLSGPIGYNKQRSVAKARQRISMAYEDTYITLRPGQIVEKIFYIDLSSVKEAGTGFQKQIYTSFDMYKPYDVERYPEYDDILDVKYKYALSRWLESEDGTTPGFCAYPVTRPEILAGWCGQADSPGFALQVLEGRLGDKTIVDKVQRSMDFLTTAPFTEDGLFNVRYRLKDGSRAGGDHVSCGQTMYNFALAIRQGRTDSRYDTQKWEKFLKTAADGVSKRILKSDWDPHSTAEAFYIAPLAISYELFGNKDYKKAAMKAADLFAEREYSRASYWGGTLDATCEDKEGAWAAFQGFLEVYEQFGGKQYLKLAKHAMDICLSYVVVWDIPYPAGRLADHNFKSTGWTVVSPQNQHLDVYGVLYAPEVYRMGEILDDARLKDLSKVMYRSCAQLTDIYGSQGEQVQQTNFSQHGDKSDVHALRGGYAETWTVFWITAHFLNASARFELMGVDL